MTWLTNILNFIAQQLLAELVVVVAGVGVAVLIQKTWNRWRYGKWHVIVLRKGKTLVNRRISPEKVKEIMAETADKAVFLKGVASPYEWINCDIIEDGARLGLLKEDEKKHEIVIDLDKNPPKSIGNQG